MCTNNKRSFRDKREIVCQSHMIRSTSQREQFPFPMTLLHRRVFKRWSIALCLVVALVWCAVAEARAETRNWAQQCQQALHSRALLARSGALLALRDRSLEHPNEVLQVFRHEPDILMRRRMALVLGEADVRRVLMQRVLKLRPALAPQFDSFEVELENARDVNAAAWTAERGPLKDVQTGQRAQNSLALSSQRLSQRTQELLSQLVLSARDSGDNRELQLLRWTIEVALLDVAVPRSEVPVWNRLNDQERVQAAQMLAAMRGQQDSPLKVPDSYDLDLNTPWLYPLLGMTAGRSGWPSRSLAEPDLAFRPLVPLLRVSLFRDERFHNNSLSTRVALARLGDRSSLHDLQPPAISELYGFNTLKATDIPARLGELEGVDQLWRLYDETLHGPANSEVVKKLARRLDLGLGEVPDSSNDINRWLSEDDQRSLREWNEQNWAKHRFGIQTMDWGPLFALESKARQAFARDLRAAFEKERTRLRYSPATQRFYPPERAAGNADAKLPPLHPGLADVGAEDEAARLWYERCARRVFDRDLDVAVGATRALLWGEAASSQALDAASRRLQRTQPERSEFLANLKRLLPGGGSESLTDPIFALIFRAYQSNDSATITELRATLARQARPIHAPILLVYAEANPALWQTLVTLNARAARPFLLREVAREKTGNEMYSPKRTTYAVSNSYFMDTFDALNFYSMKEAVPALKRHVLNSWWHTAALTPLGEIGGEEALTFLRARLAELELRPKEGIDTQLDEQKQLILVQLARNGEASRLEPCIELLKKGAWSAPYQAARALNQCLPAAPPGLPVDRYHYPSSSELNNIYEFWKQWFDEHEHQLIWNSVTRRYDLSTITRTLSK